MHFGSPLRHAYALFNAVVVSLATLAYAATDDRAPLTGPCIVYHRYKTATERLKEKKKKWEADPNSGLDFFPAAMEEVKRLNLPGSDGTLDDDAWAKALEEKKKELLEPLEKEKESIEDRLARLDTAEKEISRGDFPEDVRSSLSKNSVLNSAWGELGLSAEDGIGWSSDQVSREIKETRKRLDSLQGGAPPPGQAANRALEIQRQIEKHKKTVKQLSPFVPAEKLEDPNYIYTLRERIGRRSYYVRLPSDVSSDATWRAFLQEEEGSINDLLAFDGIDDQDTADLRRRLRQRVDEARSGSLSDKDKEDVTKMATQLQDKIRARQDEVVSKMTEALDDLDMALFDREEIPEDAVAEARRQMAQGDSPPKDLPETQPDEVSLRSRLAALESWQEQLDAVVKRRIRSINSTRELDEKELAHVEEEIGKVELVSEVYAAVEEWNKAEDAWADIRGEVEQKLNEMVSEARSTVADFPQAIKAKAQEITEEVHAEYLRAGERLLADIRARKSRYKQGLLTPAQVEKLREDIARYRRLYEREGWKEEAKEEIKRRVRQERESQAAAMFGLARRLEDYDCYGAYASLVKQLRDLAWKAAPWIPVRGGPSRPLLPDDTLGYMVAIPNLNLPPVPDLGEMEALHDLDEMRRLLEQLDKRGETLKKTKQEIEDLQERLEKLETSSREKLEGPGGFQALADLLAQGKGSDGESFHSLGKLCKLADEHYRRVEPEASAARQSAQRAEDAFSRAANWPAAEPVVAEGVQGLRDLQGKVDKYVEAKNPLENALQQACLGAGALERAAQLHEALAADARERDEALKEMDSKLEEVEREAPEFSKQLGQLRKGLETLGSQAPAEQRAEIESLQTRALEIEDPFAIEGPPRTQYEKLEAAGREIDERHQKAVASIERSLRECRELPDGIGELLRRFRERDEETMRAVRSAVDGYDKRNERLEKQIKERTTVLEDMKIELPRLLEQIEELEKGIAQRDAALAKGQLEGAAAREAQQELAGMRSDLKRKREMEKEARQYVKDFTEYNRLDEEDQSHMAKGEMPASKIRTAVEGNEAPVECPHLERLGEISLGGAAGG